MSIFVPSFSSALTSSIDNLSSLDFLSRYGFLMINDFIIRCIFLLAKIEFSNEINKLGLLSVKILKA